MSAWRALSLASVRRGPVQAALAEQGVDWSTASHVTATTSLAAALRRQQPGSKKAPGGVSSLGTHALPIATLIDLLTVPGWPGEWALPLDDFPLPPAAPEHSSSYSQAVQRWQRQASGRRMRMGIAFDDCLRRVARSGEFPDHVGQVLVSARREYARSVHALIAAGVSPTDVQATDDVTRLAVKAWATAEAEVPALAGARRDLWQSLKQHPPSPNSTQDVLERLRAALTRAYGPVDGQRTVVHHGFYFYTPPQWALFQLMRHLPEVDQYFIVHDDGDNPCFESWRRFFSPALEMPEPEPVRTQADSPTTMASALRQALAGGTVDRASLDGGLRLVECRSPAELVRELWVQRQSVERQRAAGEAMLRVFAPDADTVSRYVQRLGLSSPDARVDLAHLPVGRFLLSIHDCIHHQRNDGSRTAIDCDAMLDIASSGFLPMTGTDPTIRPEGPLRRALQYFTDCRSTQSWVQRAEQLLSLVEAEVAPLGARQPHHTDVERVAAAAANPLRVLPWADLSVSEATSVRDTVVAAAGLIEQVARLERVRLSEHVRFIRERLEIGMRGLPPDLREQVAAQVDGFSVGLDAEVEADALIDVVSLLLGREVAPETGLEPDPHGGDLDHLRGVDALGHAREQQDIHITNLADTVFPGQVAAVGWPFRLDHLRAAADQQAMLEVLDTRVAAAALSDLYLFWLALDGVEPGRTLTLSWISEVAGDPRNPSALLTLLTDPVKLSGPVRTRVGGVGVAYGAGQADQTIRHSVARPVDEPVDPAATRAVAEMLDPAAAASAGICARRFALQWAVGRSAAFQADHHQSMLYGNIYGGLVKAGLMSRALALELCDDLWAFLTAGQRTSSRLNSRVKPTGKSSHPIWRLTLKGSTSGSDPFDTAYQQAISGRRVSPALLLGTGEGFLPAGSVDEATCRQCPVRGHCRQARDRAD